VASGFGCVCLLPFLPAAGGEQHVPGGPDGEQLEPLHHLPHGGAGPGRHPRARGLAAGLRERPELQLLGALNMCVCVCVCHEAVKRDVGKGPEWRQQDELKWFNSENSTGRKGQVTQIAQELT